jgi:hypothetical protein
MAALPLLILAVIATALADPYVKRRQEVRRRNIRIAPRERAPKARWESQGSVESYGRRL